MGNTTLLVRKDRLTEARLATSDDTPLAPGQVRVTSDGSSAAAAEQLPPADLPKMLRTPKGLVAKGDTHVDHGGWAFVVGVLSYSWHARAVEAHDAILSTWKWIEADQPAG